MSLQFYPIIAIDFHGNEQSLEWEGHSQGDAAKRLLRERAHIREVRNGGHGSKNNPHRKLIRLQHGVHPDPTQTTLGQALMEAQSTQSLEAARLILGPLEKKGIRLEILTEKGVEKIVGRPNGKITPEESREIDENQAGIVALLKKQEEERAQAAALAPPPRETQRDIVRRVIPDLPDSFTRSDLQKALHDWKYHELAEKTSKLDNLLAWCATEGFITRTAKGNYQQPIRVPTAVVPEPATVAIIEPDLPAPSPQKINGAAAVPADVLPAQTATEAKMPVIPAAAEGPRPSFETALVKLTARLVAAEVEESELAEIERGAKECYDSFARFMDPVEALIKKLRANARARSEFVAQLTPGTHTST